LGSCWYSSFLTPYKVFTARWTGKNSLIPPFEKRILRSHENIFFLIVLTRSSRKQLFIKANLVPGGAEKMEKKNFWDHLRKTSISCQKWIFSKPEKESSCPEIHCIIFFRVFYEKTFDNKILNYAQMPKKGFFQANWIL